MARHVVLGGFVMRTLRLFLVTALAGCIGEISNSPSSDGGMAAPDGGAEQASYKLAGMIKDYAEPAMLPNTAVTTLGLTPALSASSDAAGAYMLENVPPGSVFYPHVMPSGETYRPTVNQAVSVLDGDVTLDLAAVTAVYAQRQNATAGVPVAPNTSIVLLDLVKPDGTPYTGVAANALTIEPIGGGVPLGVGPFFIGATGDIDPLLATSTDFGGRARAAFLNVPPGSYMAYVRGVAGGGEGGGGITPDAGQPDAAPLPPPDAGLLDPDAAPVDPPPPPPDGEITILAQANVITISDATVHGATLVLLEKIGGMGEGGGGGGGGEMPMVSFTTDVYPLLQRASAGGQGCASCHTAGGAAGGALILDDGAAIVHARLIADPELVNLPIPEASLLLTKPLYETPPNHPNATWLTTADPAYVTILGWITAGAPQ